jgi:iron complex outermembrane receptor protein
MRTRLLASSMISGAALAALFAAGAQAQDATAQGVAPPSSTGVQEVVVTGSRIPSRNLTSVSPVTTVNSTQVKLQGVTNVEDLINNLPQAFADQGAYESNGSAGIADIDLRGLGAKRTLVLIDGKRVQPGDPTIPVADINFIPPGLIDHVDVLTGGASAVYGSDAVAGVVNFVMKHDFQGLELDVQTGLSEHGNGSSQIQQANQAGHAQVGFPLLNLPTGTTWAGLRTTATIIGGANSPDDKGNVEFYLGYTSVQGVLEGKYDYSACALATNTGSPLQYCAGSLNSPAVGRVTPLTGPNAGGTYSILGKPTGNMLTPLGLSDAYNYAPVNYFQRPDTRYTAGEYSHYEINPAVDLYSSFMFMDDHTVAQLAASGSFASDATNYTIPCDDSLLSTAQRNTLCGPGDDTATVLIGRRNVEGGGRISDITHMDYRMVFGSKGDIGDGWSYDVSMQYGRSVLTDIEEGNLSKSKLANALDVGADGQCVSGPPCVAWDIWSPGGVTQQALDYIDTTAENAGYTQEQVVTGSIAGDLGHYGIKSPLATDGVGVSFGAEYRRELLSLTFDSVISSGDVAGGGGNPQNVDGSQSDKDVFAEIRVPLIQDQPFFKDLSFEGGYRYSDYSSGGGNSSFKVAGDWQIVRDFKIRASYERSVRAPNVDELFTPQSAVLAAGNDPCAKSLSGGAPTFNATQCYNTMQAYNASVPAAQRISLTEFTNNIYPNIAQCGPQCQSLTGGNPDLKPETGKTVSVGFVFTPTFFRGFSLSMDYFKINVDGAVATAPFAGTITACVLQDVGCSGIFRNPNAEYGFVGDGFGPSLPLENIGSLKTSGIDLNANYRVSLEDMHMPAWGSLNLNFTGTWLRSLVTQLPVGTYDCAGLYGLTCGTPNPKYRSQTRLTWITPWNLQLSVNWRYLSATRLDYDTSNPVFAQGFTDQSPTDARIPDFSYFDLAFSYKIKDRYTIRGGCNNIFDRTPPILSGTSAAAGGPPALNGNTFPQVFDPLGRTMFLGLTADF